MSARGSHPARGGQGLRAQHYLFAHKLLPQHAFRDPQGFMRAMDSSLAGDILEVLWQEAHVQARARGEEQGLSAEGLKARVDQVAGRRCVLIAMPRAQAVPEAQFAAFIEDRHEGELEYRYLVLEKTFSQAGRRHLGVLCEWLPDGSRRNHGRTCQAGEKQFLETLAEQLGDESRRRALGARPVSAVAWRPRREEPESPLPRSERFRYQHCVFAYEVFPKTVFSEPDRVVSEVTRLGGRELLEGLWRRAGALARQVGRGDDVSPEGLAALTAELLEQRCLVVRLPEPLVPPEAHWLAVVVPRTSRPRPSSVYTLEKAHGREGAAPLFCVVHRDLRHEILSQAWDQDVDTFLDLLADQITGVHKSPLTAEVAGQRMLHERLAELRRQRRRG